MVVIVNGGYLIEFYFIDCVLNEFGEVLWKYNLVVVCGECNKDIEIIILVNEEDIDIEVLLVVELNQ